MLPVPADDDALRAPRRLVTYTIVWRRHPQVPPEQFVTLDEMTILAARLYAVPGLRWAYQYTDYDDLQPIHSIVISDADDGVVALMTTEAQDGAVTLDHIDDTRAHLAAWARGQYRGFGNGFAIILFRTFTQMRLAGAHDRMSLEAASHVAGVAPRARYWWSFLTFCIFSRMVNREPVDIGPDMYTLGTRLSCIPEDERARARTWLATWRLPPQRLQPLPILPDIG
jgi:hypothetical protein